MTGLIKLLLGATGLGAVVGAVASKKVSDFISGNKSRISKKRVSVIEVPIGDGDPDDLEILVMKKTRDQRPRKQIED